MRENQWPTHAAWCQHLRELDCLDEAHQSCIYEGRDCVNYPAESLTVHDD